MFVNGIFTKRIVGMKSQRAAELLGYAVRTRDRDEFTVRHDWRSGDIAFWDNRSTQHRVDNDFGPARAAATASRSTATRRTCREAGVMTTADGSVRVEL